jgi:CheY-like chemotaxis protein
MTADSPALILIVDDDYDFLEINRMILERAGYRVVTASEPGQALAKMENEKPDLVITDLMMTSLDSGFSFSRTIKTDPRFTDLPVIISTSVSSALGLDFRPRSTEELAKMNVDAYFDKPLDARRLMAKVAELLAARREAAAARACDSAGAAPEDS